MRRSPFSSVRTRVILLVFLVLVPIVIMTGLNSWEHRRRAVEQATENAGNIMNFAALHEEEILRETQGILATAAEVPAVVRGGKDCDRFLSSLLKNYPRYLNFGVARRNGEVTCSAVPYQKAPNIVDRYYFGNALENNSFSIGQFQMGRITGKPSINFGYPVLDRNGKVTAVIFVALDLSYVTKLEYAVDVQTPANSTYVKLDSNGLVLSSYPAAQLFGMGNPLEKSYFERITKEKKGIFEAKGADGVERLYLFSTLSGPLYGDGAYVLLGIPTEGIYAESNRMLTRNLTILALVVIFSLAVMWFVGNILIIRPVGVLTEASKRLTAGDLTARSGLPPTLGELGQLGQAFDEMAEKLEREIKERNEAEKRISRGLKMLAGLHAIDQKIIQGANIEDTLQKVCDTVFEIGYPLCWVGLAEPDHTVRIAAVWGMEKESLENLGIRWDDSPQGSGASGTVIKTGQLYISQNILENNRFAPWRDKVIESGMRSLVSLPLKPMEGKVMGVLHVYSDQENRFSPEDIRDLETFSQQCTVALSSAKSFEDLRDAHQRLRFHVNRMPLAYIVWDRDFRVVEWNPAAERIYGWKTAEASGKHPYELIVPPDEHPHVDRVWSKLLGGDESSYSVNANVRKDGMIITCEWFNTPLRDASDNIIGVLSMVHDVTEKTRMEKQLQTAQRMESVGTLAGGIAHDFNNALTGIFGFGELLRQRMAGDEESSHDLDEILRCAERAATLTRQLLTFARRQVIEPVNLNLSPLVENLMKFVGKAVGEHIELKTSLGNDVPTIHADPGQIEQVVMNLCLNARDAMPKGGRLEIETKEAILEEEHVRQYPYMKTGRYSLLTVSDTGIGMDEKTRDRVFEPFFTTKGPDKGTGLGMAMVYGIVKQHGGFIHLYSEPGKGTVFKVYFPAVEAQPDAVTVKRREEIVRGGTETILLAEDEGPIRALAGRVLTGLGYTVLAARNGEDAVEMFRQNKEIALAVLDVVMPRKGGKEAFEEMRRQDPQMKVIFMSGYSADTIHESFVLTSDMPFLQKPFGPTILARKIREVLDGK